MRFDVPKQDLDCFKQIKGFEYVNPLIEIWTMLKSIYDFKDAPRRSVRSYIGFVSSGNDAKICT